jgi:hypothetical protein
MKVALEKLTPVVVRSRGRMRLMTSAVLRGAVSIWFVLLAAAPLLGQPVVTGVEVFTTDASGTPVAGFVWNTVAGDSVPNAWVDTPAGHLNGPTDSLAPVMIVPEFGNDFFNVRNDFTFNPNYIGVSLWFNSAATPQISVFGSTSDFGHSIRPGFSDTFTDGIWTVKVGSQNAGSIGWGAPGAPILDERIDVVAPFAVGSNGVLDATLQIRFEVTPEPSIVLLSAFGMLILLALRWRDLRYCRNPLTAQQGHCSQRRGAPRVCREVAGWLKSSARRG